MEKERGRYKIEKLRYERKKKGGGGGNEKKKEETKHTNEQGKKK